MKVGIKFPDQEMTQEIKGDYTLEQMANGYILLGYLLREIQEFNGHHNAVALDKEVIESLGMSMEEFGDAVDVLLSYSVNYKQKKKRKKTTYGYDSCLFTGTERTNDKVIIKVSIDGYIQHMIKGMTLKEAAVKECEEMKDALRKVG